MNIRERFQAVVNFGQPDRLPVIEWAPWWDETLDRWYHEGMPRHLTEKVDIDNWLGLDPCDRLYAAPLTSDCPQPVCNGAGIIETEQDYALIRDKLYSDSWLDKQLARQKAERKQQGLELVWFTIQGFFWFPRVLLGIERHMYAFYDQGGLLHRINNDILEFNLRAIDQLCQYCVPEFCTVAEDMSYNNGPMLSKECFEEFIAPYYRRIVTRLKKNGITPFVDSDGDVHKLIPWLVEAGIEGILPLERMAGVDVNRIRQDYPKLSMLGGFDKTVIHRGEDAIHEEFERILPAMRSGGYLPAVDHQTPPDVSLDDYRLFVKIYHHYAHKAVE